jgi:hypothetical protein
METDLIGSLQSSVQSSTFSPWALFFGFVFSVFGFTFFRRGRSRGNLALIGVGLASMIYPYFIYSPWAVFWIGLVLCLFAYKLWNK